MAKEPLQFLAEEQAALRRVAMLVAEGAEPRAVFDAVCEETGRLVGARIVNLAHFTPDAMNLTMSGWSHDERHVPTGTRLPLEEGTINTLVHRTGAPGRVDTYDNVPGELAELLRKLGIRSEVGAPVVVDGEVWGALIAGTDERDPLPPGTESRVASFAELVATAVSNATARAELIASRARLVAAADEARRKFGRDIHDGAQQRLVSAIISLQLAEQDLDDDVEASRAKIREAREEAQRGLQELRELAAGLHPTILADRGLRAAIDGLAQRSPMPVESEVPEERYPSHVEAAAYFLIAEALTNVAKHAGATRARVRVNKHDGLLAIEVADDGRGGANPASGSGLRGLRDRAEALGGSVAIDSAPGAGTRVRAMLVLSALD
jgi:signal transduction histidine kinase